jgi:hypothetical protein
MSLIFHRFPFRDTTKIEEKFSYHLWKAFCRRGNILEEPKVFCCRLNWLQPHLTSACAGYIGRKNTKRKVKKRGLSRCEVAEKDVDLLESQGAEPPPPFLYAKGRQGEIIWTRKLPPSSPLGYSSIILQNHIKFRTCSALAPYRRKFITQRTL